MTDISAIRKLSAETRERADKAMEFIETQGIVPTLCDAIDELTAEVERLRAENIQLQSNWVPVRYQSNEARGTT